MRLLVIDSNSLLHRAFHALPPLTTKKGEQTGAVYGFLLTLFKAINETKPNFIVATFDTPTPTFRHKEFKEYKITRPPVPKELSQQIPNAKEVLKALGIPIFEKKGFEADDLLGTISRLASKKQVVPKIETIILSGDLDTLQLIDSQTKVYTFKKRVKDTILYDTAKVEERYGIGPSQLPDFKALTGDPSDNIPGVSGIGEKTATKLIKEFNNLENLYSALEKRGEVIKKLKTKLKDTLLQSKEQAFFSKTLSKVKRDVPIDFDLEKCRFKRYNKDKVIQLFKKLDFYSLIKRLPEPGEETDRGQNENNSPIRKNLRLW